LIHEHIILQEFLNSRSVKDYGIYFKYIIMQLTIIDAVWAQQSLRFAVLLLALMLLIISSWSRSRSRFDWSTSVPFRIGEVLLPTLGAAIRIATAFYISAILRFFSWRVTLSTLKVLIR